MQSNPDWIMMLDREASFSADKRASSVPAQDVINNSPALKNTTAISKEQIIYAPDDTYTNESIQTYLERIYNKMPKHIIPKITGTEVTQPHLFSHNKIWTKPFILALFVVFALGIVSLLTGVYDIQG